MDKYYLPNFVYSRISLPGMCMFNIPQHQLPISDPCVTLPLLTINGAVEIELIRPHRINH